MSLMSDECHPMSENLFSYPQKLCNVFQSLQKTTNVCTCNKRKWQLSESAILQQQIILCKDNAKLIGTMVRKNILSCQKASEMFGQSIVTSGNVRCMSETSWLVMKSPFNFWNVQVCLTSLFTLNQLNKFALNEISLEMTLCFFDPKQSPLSHWQNVLTSKVTSFSAHMNDT